MNEHHLLLSDRMIPPKVKVIEVCPQCKSQELISDMFHAEVYCQECGLVVVDRTSTRFKDIILKKEVPREPTPYEYYLMMIANGETAK